MARVKKRPSQAQQNEPASEPRVVEAEELKPSALEYLLQFGVFTVFCLVSAGLVKLVTGYTLGLNFFFGVLILGFFIVCVFSYFHDRMYQEEDEPNSGP